MLLGSVPSEVMGFICNNWKFAKADYLGQGGAFSMQDPAWVRNQRLPKMTDYLGHPLRLGVVCRGPKPTRVRGAFRLPQRFRPLVKGLVGEEVVSPDLICACQRIEAGRCLEAIWPIISGIRLGVTGRGPKPTGVGEWFHAGDEVKIWSNEAGMRLADYLDHLPLVISLQGPQAAGRSPQTSEAPARLGGGGRLGETLKTLNPKS